MKRIVSILLVAIVLLAMSLIPAYAIENMNPGEYIYEERFVEQHVINTSYGDPYMYDELYYHHVDENDPNSEIDWVLVYTWYLFEDMTFCTRIGNRIVYVGARHVPFITGYGVYDVKQDCFFDLAFDNTVKKYEDLEDVVNNKVRIGNLLGDIDLDERLTILDATTLQIGLVEGKYRDPYSEENNIADFDRDRKVTVMDATAIQMKLAGIEA
ncbi:MAG: hypothetical protein IKB73_02075 [Ruminococcus sp.]|nr:hypothetical protein [Ruminococcus sp.]